MGTVVTHADSRRIASLVHRAMGVTCRVTVHGHDAHVVARKCVEMLDKYEGLWSRFIASSDICRLNAASGSTVWVDPMTATLVAHMQAGVDATGGRFNPTLLPWQVAAGDSASLVDERVTTIDPGSRAFSDLSGIQVFRDGRVRLPAGMTLDAGGIAKGFAADLITEMAIRMGADSVCINIGGDLRVSGPTPDGHGWNIDILDPRDLTTRTDTVCIASGAVATSAIGARNLKGSPLASHILDSRPGDAPRRTIGASVIASTAAWSEVWAKFAILADVPEALDTYDRNGLAVQIVLADGRILHSRSWKDFRP